MQSDDVLISCQVLSIKLIHHCCYILFEISIIIHRALCLKCSVECQYTRAGTLIYLIALTQTTPLADSEASSASDVSKCSLFSLD